MKEIIYIQAGNLANHIGTHFWNTQESYFTYGEDAPESIVNHDISFREGTNHKSEPTFSPRLLVFDRKANFGALSNLYGEDDTEDMISQWQGDVVEYRQQPIEKSGYHVQFESEEGLQDNEDTKVPRVKDPDVRFWSDYSRVFLHPRTFQRLPDVAEWEDTEGDWNSGIAAFQKFDEEKSLMEDYFRLFVEECDSLQGIQLTNDAATFGSFSVAFLNHFRDEFAKLPCLTFSLLSNSVPGLIDADNTRGIRKALNDALCIQALNEVSTVTIPIQSPDVWKSGAWMEGLNLNLKSRYHASAIISTHIENITLPLRLRGGTQDLSAVTSALNWRGDTKFSQLSGIFPLPSAIASGQDFERPIYDMSAPTQGKAVKLNPKSIVSQMDVSRGFREAEKVAYEEWRTDIRPLPHNTHAPAVPIPTSFPSFFTFPHPRKLSAFTSLRTTTRTASLFSSYASIAEQSIWKYGDVITRMGLEVDEIKELKEGLWALEDAYRGDESGSDRDGGDDE